MEELNAKLTTAEVALKEREEEFGKAEKAAADKEETAREALQAEKTAREEMEVKVKQKYSPYFV